MPLLVAYFIWLQSASNIPLVVVTYRQSNTYNRRNGKILVKCIISIISYIPNIRFFIGIVRISDQNFEVVKWHVARHVVMDANTVGKYMFKFKPKV